MTDEESSVVVFLISVQKILDGKRINPAQHGSIDTILSSPSIDGLYWDHIYANHELALTVTTVDEHGTRPLSDPHVCSEPVPTVHSTRGKVTSCHDVWSAWVNENLCVAAAVLLSPETIIHNSDGHTTRQPPIRIKIGHQKVVAYNCPVKPRCIYK